MFSEKVQSAVQCTSENINLFTVYEYIYISTKRDIENEFSYRPKLLVIKHDT